MNGKVCWCWIARKPCEHRLVKHHNISDDYDTKCTTANQVCLIIYVQLCNSKDYRQDKEEWAVTSSSGKSQATHIRSCIVNEPFNAYIDGPSFICTYIINKKYFLYGKDIKCFPFFLYILSVERYEMNMKRQLIKKHTHL